jgi:hypothetical protein
VTTDSGKTFSVPLGDDGWLDVPVDGDGPVVALSATDEFGHAIRRLVRLSSSSVEFD